MYLHHFSPVFADTIWVPIPDFNKWNVADFNNLRPTEFSHQGRRLQFAEQTDDVDFERDIYQKSIVATRPIAHDFFNNVSWLQFPKAKSKLNSLYVAQGSTARTTKQNALALFDENGAIVVAPRATLELLREHNWAEAFAQPLQCYLFGHSIWEKLLSPYLSITAHAIFIEAEAIDKLAVDALAAQALEIINQPKDLNPLPVMGIKHWHSAPHSWRLEQKDVFRPLRQKRGIVLQLDDANRLFMLSQALDW